MDSTVLAHARTYLETSGFLAGGADEDVGDFGGFGHGELVEDEVGDFLGLEYWVADLVVF